MLKEEIREQRKSLKGKGIGAYLQYFWDYYKWAALVVILAVVLVIYTLVSVLGKKDTALNAVFLNADNSLSETEEKMVSDYASYAGIDLDTYDVDIMLSLYQTSGGGSGSTYDMAAQSTIDTQIQSHTLDVIVCEPGNFEYYATLSEFVDVRTVLSDEQIRKYQDSFCYVDVTELERVQAEIADMNYESLESTSADTSDSSESSLSADDAGALLGTDPSVMDDPVPIGIIVTDASYIADHEIYAGDEAILGFALNSERTSAAAEFLEFLFEV